MSKNGGNKENNITMGVYEIKNIVNNKVYIGSSKNVGVRLIQHRSSLKKGKHHSSHLQKSYDKYGVENFLFTVLEEVSDYEELREIEQKWMDNKESYRRDKGYNIKRYATYNTNYFNQIETRQSHGVKTSRGLLRSGWTRVKGQTVKDVKLMLRDYDITYLQIAYLCDIKESDVYNIIYGMSGRHYPIKDEERLDVLRYPEASLVRKVDKHGHIERKISKEDCSEIHFLYKNTRLTQVFLSEVFSVDRRVIADVLKGKYHGVENSKDISGVSIETFKAMIAVVESYEDGKKDNVYKKFKGLAIES